MNRNIRIPSKRQRGFSIIELLIVLGLIAGLLALVFFGSQKGEASISSRGLIQQGQALAVGLRVAYPAGGNPAGRFTGLTNTNFIESQQAPREMVQGASALTHSDNGTVTCTAATLNGVANAGASCVFTGVKGTSCAGLVGSMRDTVSNITIGTTVVKNATTPYANAAVNTACNADTLSITLVLG